jgi:hypothetical protein
MVTLNVRQESTMNWNIDNRTQQAATNHPLPINAMVPAEQFAGRNFNPLNWNSRVNHPANWPQEPLVSSPQMIINEFQQQHYLQGLALVVSWGTMWRQPAAIWGHRHLNTIDMALHNSAQSIQNTQSIDQAWGILTGNQQGQLGWSAVITSKTLHFLSRSLGIVQDPPVAIDNAVILNHVWPAFIAPINHAHRPQNWRGNTLAAYLRYMTAILAWANQRYWTTTDMEATIFDEY